MNKHVKVSFFDQKELKLLIKLLVNFWKFDHKGADAFGWDDIVIHEDWRQTFNDLYNFFRMQQHFNYLLLGYTCEKFIAFRADFVTTEKGCWSKLIEKVQNKGDKFDFENGFFWCFSALFHKCLKVGFWHFVGGLDIFICLFAVFLVELFFFDKFFHSCFFIFIGKMQF